MGHILQAYFGTKMNGSEKPDQANPGKVLKGKKLNV